MKLITKSKNPLIIASSVLGLSLAVSACTTTNAQTSAPAGMENGKARMWQKGERSEHKGWGMKGGMGEHKGMGGMMGKGMQELNLTDAQKIQLEQLRTQNQAKMQQFKAQLDQMDANIATQKAAGASTATLLGLYQQKQATMDQFFAMHQQQRQQFINILTPEQQLKMYESQGRGHDKDGKGKGDMQRPPMPR